MQYFNIQVASQLSGVASATIRAWEKRYNAIVPERAENKHRLYSEKDIEKLALLYKLTDLGQSIGKIAHLNLEELKKIYSSVLHRPYDESSVILKTNDKLDYEKILLSFHLALAAYKLDILSHELEKAKNLLSPRDFALNILVPLFHEIGNKVSRGELSIAQEHTLSAIVTFHMGQMIGAHYQKTHLREQLILITTPEGELHEIGILASALLCVQYKIRFIYLGASLPATSLAEAANSLGAKAILLGVTRYDTNDNKNLEEYLRVLESELTNKVDIWIGGNVKNLRSDIEKRRLSLFNSLHSFDEFLEKF